ncbi:PREDICTED: uncharacterized protein LOC105118366 isoform X2 [Populus euphratica]|uniref:Uncharacterized protein LOC105118366 isoform X2 n=1 Tax=Populus euphratica TaxID=75702 RepID=A0AAJ6TNF6_POPEU|nr:PREDICTED: uncharacterized protein LOC105118366 isoform X2 [Populus euphratica]
MRNNLDPVQHHNNEEFCEVLRHCHLDGIARQDQNILMSKFLKRVKTGVQAFASQEHYCTRKKFLFLMSLLHRSIQQLTVSLNIAERNQ